MPVPASVVWGIDLRLCLPGARLHASAPCKGCHGSCAQDNCTPNVVTYNTLVDVYGKMGDWERAIDVLDRMKGQARTQKP